MDYHERENLWDEQWPEGEQEDADEHPPEEPDLLDEEEPFPEITGTTDPVDAVRDAEPYVPPIDPPVLPGGEGGIHVATGFGVSSVEEAYEGAPPRGDEDIHDEALQILREDSATLDLPLDVEVLDGVVYLRGRVSSLEDADYAATLIGEYVPGVVDVVDETVVATGTGE